MRQKISVEAEGGKKNLIVTNYVLPDDLILLGIQQFIYNKKTKSAEKVSINKQVKDFLVKTGVVK